MTNQIKLIQGDCIDMLKTIDSNSIDAIVTDPPYELGFMGKSWDNTGIANNVEMWAECLRVLKPGGHLLAFSGTRTYHRMASAIEDAGFEVRDMIEWCYGSGFPKSLNIGKAVDKLQGNEREVVGQKDINAIKALQKFKEQDGRTVKTDFSNIEMNYTKGTSEWEGWGTALKPAHEPICMARKPLDRWWKIKDDGKKVMGRVMTVAENCLKWGTGGINIDESRVGFNKDNENFGKEVNDYGEKAGGQWQQGKQIRSVPPEQGRFPANLIHDNSEEVRECFPESKGGAFPKTHGSSGFVSPEEKESRLEMNDSGSAARFFKSILYYPKASKSERNKGCEDLDTTEKFTAGNYSQSPTCKDCEKTLNGTNDHSKCSGEVYYKEMESKNTKNNHPTVKPIALMEYLINMVTREGQTVLDMFMGSGTTGVACKNLNRNFIGIEKEEEYFKIANARIYQEETNK